MKPARHMISERGYVSPIYFNIELKSCLKNIIVQHILSKKPKRHTHNNYAHGPPYMLLSQGFEKGFCNVDYCPDIPL